MIVYRILKEEEICRELFAGFIRHQVVTKCWRREKGEWVIRDAPFIDDWTEEEYRILVKCLKNTASTGGFVFAAFCDGTLKGFASVEPALFGGEQGYLDLSCIHVSEDAGERNRKGPFPGCRGLGQGPRRAEALHIRPFRRGEPGFLQGHGLRGSGEVPSGACGGGTL